jgi:uncharacterized coiled-coil protein SlyX
MEDLTCYISFSDAQNRYEIKQAALSYRIKALGLKTKRKGRNTLLTLKHISLLDDLDKYLKENPGKTIDEFLALQKPELQSTTADLPITKALNSQVSLINQSTTDESLINQCITDESVMNRDLTQVKNQINLILQAISRLEGHRNPTNESLINKLNYLENVDKDSEITKLKEQINQLTEKLTDVNQSCELLKQINAQLLYLCQQCVQLSITKTQECDDWKNFWSAVIPFEPIHNLLYKVGGRIHLKTNYIDFSYAQSIFYRGLSLFNR